MGGGVERTRSREDGEASDSALERALRVISALYGKTDSRWNRLHNGVIGDYVAWLVFGLLVFGSALAM